MIENKAIKVDKDAEIKGSRVDARFAPRHRRGMHIGFGMGRPRMHDRHRHIYSGEIGPVGQFFIFLLFLVIGAGCLFFGIKRITTDKYDNYVSVAGKIIDYNETFDGEYMYAPIYEYYVGEDRYILISNSRSSNPPSKGKTKEILYDPNDPTNAIIKSDESIVMIITLIVGAVFTPLGIVGCVSSIRKKIIV